MKVVLFCGGYGMRMRDGVSDLPKPMHTVGPRPLIWHVMRYYAHFGHTDFILCLGYGAHHIKDFFLHYDETASNDFVLRGGDVDLLTSDIQDWTITFRHTGLDTPIGERLRRVRPLVEGEEMFLANYADVLTDAPLDQVIKNFEQSEAAASLLAVPPQSAFHCIEVADDDRITSVSRVADLPIWENGGYFVLRSEIFDVIPENGDLVEDGITTLAEQKKMLAYRHRGFWAPADTVKERTALEAAYQSGHRPWMLWDTPDRDPLQAAIAAIDDRNR